MLTPVLLYCGEFLPPKHLYYKTHNIWLSKEAQSSIIPLRQNTTFNTESSNSNTKMLKNTTKPIVIFIGGFLDSYHQVIFREFVTFTQDSCLQLAKIPFVAKVYSTFSCKKLFTSLLPEILTLGYVPYIIAHSWGASNICKALESCVGNLPNNAIPLLLTLDPVGYWQPSQAIKCVEKWINIYIANKWKHCCNASNICTFIGHAWNECKYANENISINNQHFNNISDKDSTNTRKKPITHASVGRMLQVFNNPPMA